MNKTLIIVIIAAVLGLGGLAGALYVSQSDNYSDETNNSESSESMEKETDAMVDEDEVMVDEESMSKDDGAMMKEDSRYVVLADFDSNSSAYDDQTKVYFFHASWCPICQGIDKEINADTNKIPEGTVFIKTDFDDNTDLRKKYSVTTQYTFVQVDNDGNQIAKWSATSLDRAINGIQS